MSDTITLNRKSFLVPVVPDKFSSLDDANKTVRQLQQSINDIIQSMQISGNKYEIYPESFGAKSDGTDAVGTTAAIRAAHSYATTLRSYHSGGEIGYGQAAVGGEPVVKYQAGTYLINDDIPIGAFANIDGVDGGTFIKQTNPTKKIFYNTADWYRGSINNISFVGGTNQIRLENSNLNIGKTVIKNCYNISNDNTEWAIYIKTPSGHVEIERNTNQNSPRWLYTYSDQTRIKGGWLNCYADATGLKPDNTASIENHSFLMMDDVLGVPEIDGSGTSANTRWIDNYGNLEIIHTRFGLENGGLNPIWDYTNCADNTSYPYINNTGISIIDSAIGASGKALITLKVGVPHTIHISRSTYSADSILIKDSIPGGVAAWIAAAIATGQAPVFSINIDQVPSRNATIISDAAALTALTPYLNYDILGYTGNTRVFSDIAITKDRGLPWPATFICSGSGTITLNTGTGRIGRYTRYDKVIIVTGTFSVASVSSPVGDLFLRGLPYVPTYGGAANVSIYGINPSSDISTLNNAYNAAYAIWALDPSNVSKVFDAASTFAAYQAGLANNPYYQAFVSPSIPQITISKLVNGIDTGIAGDIKAGSVIVITAIYLI
jgi:hypothetical protein